MENQHKLFYETRHTPLGNAYEVHSTHKGEELVKNIPIAAFLIDTFGGKLKLLPNNITNKNSRDLIMPNGVKEGKYPDALWNNEIWEFKTNTTGNFHLKKRDRKGS